MAKKSSAKVEDTLLNTIKSSSKTVYGTIHTLAETIETSDINILQMLVNSAIVNLMQNPNSINDVIDNYHFSSVSPHVSKTRINQIRDVVINGKFTHTLSQQAVSAQPLAFHEFSPDEQTKEFQRHPELVTRAMATLDSKRWTEIYDISSQQLKKYYLTHPDEFINLARYVIGRHND